MLKYLLLLFLAQLAFAASSNYRLDVKVGDKLTTSVNGRVTVYYIQALEPSRDRFLVYSMSTESQYFMDKSYLQRYIQKLERRTETVYVKD